MCMSLVDNIGFNLWKRFRMETGFIGYLGAGSSW